MEDLRLELLEEEVEREIKNAEKAIRTAEKTINIAYKVARRVAKRFLPNLLVATDKKYLEHCIETNYTVYDKIIEYHQRERGGKLTKKQKKAWKTFKTAIKLFKKFSKVIETFIDDFLTYEFIIEAIEENRPDLADVLKTEKGKKWLEQNIRELRNILGV